MEMQSLEMVDRAIVLVACQDVHGFYRFPGCYEGLAGFLIERTSIGVQQLEMAVASNLGEKGLAYKIGFEHVMTPMLTLSGDRPALLLFARLAKTDFIAPESWPTLPDILKKMPKNKNRIAYLKVMQVLSGAWDQKLDAIEFNESTVSELFGELWKN